MLALRYRRLYFRLRRGLTLLELVLVVAVLAALGAIVVASLGHTVNTARDTLIRASLSQLRTVILDSYYHDQFDTLPYPLDPSRLAYPQLVWLLVNPNPGTPYDPVARRGWRGPYLLPPVGSQYVIDATRGFTAQYGENGDPALLDGWRRPIVLQQPVTIGSAASASDLRFARLVSAGANGVLDTPSTALVPSASQVGDDLILPLGAGL